MAALFLLGGSVGLGIRNASVRLDRIKQRLD